MITKPSVVSLILLAVLCAVALGVFGLTRVGLPLVDARSEEPALLQQAAMGVPSTVADAAASAAPPSDPLPAGLIYTQTFDLQAGWNAIYLEVEPINSSPVTITATADNGESIWAHELSTLEAVFAQLADCACLESVWTLNVPQSTVDYIVDPAEGLWDEPGWRRYFPEDAVGPDDESLAFLTDLLSLHANTAYLVHLSAPATLAVSGRPQVGHHRWLSDSYNLAGFPIHPDTPPTRAGFFAGSPVSGVHRLTAAGTWEPMADADRLASGEAYLVFYEDDGARTFNAPLNIMDVLGDGLNFGAGIGGRSRTIDLENLSESSAGVQLSLVGGADAAVALWLTAEPVSGTLKSATGQEIELAAQDADPVTFSVPSIEQPAAGAAILQIASTQLGVRWLVPVTAESHSRTGLWVGEVVVNDVSEGRLGATNVADGVLSISLRSQGDSGISGAAEMRGIGESTSLTITLALLSQPLPEPHKTPAFTPTVSGYVFQDLNMNGQRDGDEPGFEGVTIMVGKSVTTAKDGFFAVDSVIDGPLSLSAPADLPANFTSSFTVTLPVTPTQRLANTLPDGVTLTDGVITAVGPSAYQAQTLYFLAPDYELPHYDSNDEVVPPLLNFGYVSTYQAVLGEGTCGAYTNPQPLGSVINGRLVTSVNQHIETLADGHAIAILDHNNGLVACGDTSVSTPAQPLTFRVILEVDPNGHVALLPRKEFADTNRIISAATFSMPGPVADGNGIDVNDPSGSKTLQYIIHIDSNDPLNPFKHKYHPDHDNLTRQFLPYTSLPTPPEPYQLEAPNIRRQIDLELIAELGNLPGFQGQEQAEINTLATQVDWGGATWGGRYTEVLQGLHKNDITLKGYFIIRHILDGAAQ